MTGREGVTARGAKLLTTSDASTVLGARNWAFGDPISEVGATNSASGAGAPACGAEAVTRNERTSAKVTRPRGVRAIIIKSILCDERWEAGLNRFMEIMIAVSDLGAVLWYAGSSPNRGRQTKIEAITVRPLPNVSGVPPTHLHCVNALRRGQPNKSGSRSLH